MDQGDNVEAQYKTIFKSTILCNYHVKQSLWKIEYTSIEQHHT